MIKLFRFRWLGTFWYITLLLVIWSHKDPSHPSLPQLHNAPSRFPHRPSTHSCPCCPAVKTLEATWVLSLPCLEAVVAAHGSSSSCQSHLFFLSHFCPLRTILPFPFLFPVPNAIWAYSTYCVARSLLASRSGVRTQSVALFWNSSQTHLIYFSQHMQDPRVCPVWDLFLWCILKWQFRETQPNLKHHLLLCEWNLYLCTLVREAADTRGLFLTRKPQ